MGFFKRRTHCWVCKARDHVDPAVHAERALALEIEAFILKRDVKETLAREGEDAACVIEDELLIVRDKLSTEQAYIRRITS